MENTNSLNRRDFMRLAGLAGAATLAAPGFAFAEAKKRKFEIGATFILWGYGANNLEPSLQDISALGYHAFETFGNVIEDYEKNRGGFLPVVQKYGVPLVSTFCQTDIVDPSKKAGDMEKLVRWAKMTKAAGGKVIEYCASGVNRKGFDYKQHKDYMVSSMNDYAKAVTDEGLVCALHPHTGTAIETEEEIYYVMENVDTRYMKFGPDVGQIQKGGGDPVKICKDFVSLIEHVHLKDFAGGDNGWLGYSPLGQGKVQLATILDMLEKKKKKMAGMIMFELDYDNKVKPAYTPLEAAKISRDFLASLDYKFEKKTI
ncbi:sugar phosphate isomerase/epimerase family protein [Mucilaginibacter auburnensis]|uniref:Inosose dehydratase n=1 Tax=Mucilaginibacter auburnensis TaxID=1457233 RepID=A0A2H9VSJ3_9SPHI|nr:TIM barrel protein [Mucilaginibacter auburnensis]PJJ83788.1 inosose dehydratase [Mucilaginibacter auburnensis]